MLRSKRKARTFILVFVVFCLLQARCSSVFYSKSKSQPTALNRSIIKKYSIRDNDLPFIQYFLGNRIELEGGAAHNYEHVPFKLKHQTTHKSDIIFKEGLPGVYIRHEINERGFGRWKKDPITFIIQFEQPRMNLKFKQDKDGYFTLVTKKEKGKRVLYFEGKKYWCKVGANTRLWYDAEHLKDINKKDRYLAGARLVQKQKDRVLWEVILGLAAILLFAQYLNNK